MTFRLLGMMLEIDVASLFLRVPFVGQIHISPLGFHADPWSRARLG